MIHELRIYRCAPGRADRVADGLRDFAADGFRRHGFRPLGFWLHEDEGMESVVYLLEWDSREHREAGWAAFKADLQWAAFLERARVDGPAIVDVSSRLMTALPSFPDLDRGPDR